MGSITRTEWQSWASLAALGGVFWWFQMRMLDGFTIVDQPAGKLLGVYFTVIALSTFAEILIAALDARGGKVVKDERDHAIEARANQNERFFIIAAVNVLVWQALWEGAFAGHALPKIDLGSLPTLFFWLMTILYIGEMVKRISTITLYRLQSAGG
jgi:hypothetical protein